MKNLDKYVDGSKIAILDDSEIWGEVLKQWLKTRFSLDEINTYLDHNTLLEDLSNKRYDCIILDYYLNFGIEAPEVIKDIRSQDPNVLLITTSASFNKETYFQNQNMRKALNAGSNRVAMKDLDSIEIILSTHLCVRKNGLCKV